MKKKMNRFISIWMLLMINLSFVVPTANVLAQVTEDYLGYSMLAESEKPSELVTVKDFNVIDGDTADFILDRSEEPSIKARFLLIDAPELENKPYAKEAKNRVRELLKQANKIQVEYEGSRKDRYGRDLVHVWVDDLLISEILVSEGLAIARYIDGYISNSAYADTIYQSQKYASNKGAKVWDGSDSEYLAKAEYDNAIQSPPVVGTEEVEEETPAPAPPTSPAVGEYVDENGNGLIKGSNSGIYHVPGSTYYDRTTNPATWFKTVDETVNAGYRAPKR